jgi:trans-AT polyketide synthase/acyltransferase/oxidoreductase domain-containing protein
VPLARHFERLAIYQASAVRLEPGTGDPEDLVGEGGGLQVAFAEHGRGPAVEVLRDGGLAAVRLADGDLEVAVERQKGSARMIVRWSGSIVVDEEVEIGPATPTSFGPLFRPDPAGEVHDIAAALHLPSIPLYAVREVGGAQRWYDAGIHGPGTGQRALLGSVPPLAPSQLGAAAFRERYGVKWAYVAGAMAGGIASPELVLAMAEAGLLAFYGAGGVPLDRVDAALQQLAAASPSGPWGANLLHNPVEPAVEERTVDLFLEHGVRRASASAYMRLTPAVLRYRLHGIHEDGAGRIVCPNHVFAKVSRTEVAEQFLKPAAAVDIVALVTAGVLTESQARLARQVPVASAITVEADSGGHTDHRPLSVILPQLRRLRDRVCAQHEWSAAHRPLVGAAGGLGTPAAVWGAFSLGADYVLTGSVNQASVEAGTSQLVREMLSAAGPTDVASGPAPDMFERGAKVQVLSRGAMYAQRAQRLYDLYRRYGSLDELPDKERARLERSVFKRPLDDVWADTETYWQERDPEQVERAKRDEKHRMALTFRWYLGMTSRWARHGELSRQRDFQVWCGPAMGAFNDWARGTAMEPLAARSVVAIASSLMWGAAAHARVASARTQGLELPLGVFDVGLVHSAPDAEEGR